MRTRTRNWRPRFEMLEDRLTPSTFVVENLADSGPGSMLQAVLDANALTGADVITFAPAARDGTIALAGGQLDVTDDLTIDGPGANRLTVSGENASRVFSIVGSATNVEIRDLTIANGRATGDTATGPSGPVTLGGGILNTGASLVLSHVTMENNTAAGLLAQGGAIANVAGGTLTITHGDFTNNRAAGHSAARGGAIANDGASTLVLDHSTFTGNEATTSRGFGAPANGNARSGAIANGGGSVATVSHSVFVNNRARGGDGADGGPGQNGVRAGLGVGGAIGNDVTSLLVPFASSTLTVAHCTFRGNLAVGGNAGDGGAGGNGGGFVAGGFAGEGAAGAINNAGSTLTVTNSIFAGNQAIGGAGGSGGAGGNGGAGGPGSGGAISCASPPANLTGGAPVRATLQVSNSVFLGNEAIGGAGGAGGSGGSGGAGGPGQGGGLRATFTDWDVSNCVFIFNRAVGGAGGDRGIGGLLGGSGGVGQGGGVFNVSGSIGALFDATIVGNTAGGGSGGLGGNGGNGQGGGVFNGGPTTDGTPSLTIRDSTIVNNRADGGEADSDSSAGAGFGGGIYVAPGGTVWVDLVSEITGNHASTGDDDVFGMLCFN